MTFISVLITLPDRLKADGKVCEVRRIGHTIIQDQPEGLIDIIFGYSMGEGLVSRDAGG